MKKKIFIAAAVLISSAGSAQDSTKVLDEIVITANKFPNKTSQTGKVLTVITREQLERSGGQDLSEVLNQQAGLSVNGSGSNPGKDKSLFLLGAKVDHTLIMLDGVPLYDPSGIGSNFDIRLLAIDNIERIEILKGSQSTLYGSDAIAGVVNIITRKGGSKKAEFSGMAGYGSYNTFHGNAAFSGKMNELDYRVNYTYYKTAGINEATDTVTAPHITDKDGYEQSSFYAAIGYQPSRSVRIQPYIRYTRYNGNIDQGAFRDELDYTTALENVQAGIRNELQFGKLRLNILYNYNDIKRIYIDDSVKSRNGFDIYSKGLYKGSEHFAEAYLVYPFANLLKLTAGVDYRSSGSDQEFHSVSVYGPYDSKLGRDSLKQHQLGIYAALVINSGKGFNAEIGGRFNRHSSYGNNAVFNFNPSFLLEKRWKLFVNLSSGYKTPSLYQLFSEYGNRQLKPETAINTEAGIQFLSVDNKAGARVTWFYRSVKDVIFFYTDPASYISYYINQDKQKDNGIEVESSLQLGKRATLKLNYDYVDGQVTTRNSGKDTSYFNLIRRPRSTFGITLGLQPCRQFYVSMRFNGVGKRTDISYDQNFNPVEIRLNAYSLLSFYADYSLMKGKIRCFADLQNITNTKYTEVYGFNTTGFHATTGVRIKL